MTATAPQTPRRSKRHHPIVFTAGSPPSHPKPRHDKWASPPLHSRDVISADLIDDEESLVDASTTFYPYFIRPSRISEKLSKVASVKFFYRRQYFSQQVFEGQVWALAAPARPSALLLTCPGLYASDRYSDVCKVTSVPPPDRARTIPHEERAPRAKPSDCPFSILEN